MLSTRKIVANGLFAFIKWIGDRCNTASEYEQDRRLAICNPCEHYTDTPKKLVYKTMEKLKKGGKICEVCGCIVKNKVKVLNQNCPVEDTNKPGYSKWGKPMVIKQHKKEVKLTK